MLVALECQKLAEMEVREGLLLAAASCQEMPEMGKGERLPLAAMRCQINAAKIGRNGGGGTSVNYRELQGKGRNEERGDNDVSCDEVPTNY